ncbi:MAG: hypothetical protein B7Y44_03790 [Sphingomonadales bacterium 28-55-16]|nr:MAG: hypothetical protein B7Y44_03790 [Sphingomonadales bacterium 28-55-16]
MLHTANRQNCVKGHTKVSPRRMPQFRVRNKISNKVGTGCKREVGEGVIQCCIPLPKNERTLKNRGEMGKGADT